MDNQTIAIYGAQMVAVSVYYAIRKLDKSKTVYCFIVKSQSGNPVSIDGIPVMPLSQFFEKNMEIWIATPEDQHANIIEDLEKRGLSHYVCVDSEKEAALMERYYKEAGNFPSIRAYSAGGRKAEVSVYMSKFYRDRPLNGIYDIPGWIQPIQAGTSLADIYVADIRDNVGDNISEKNVNYSELTAMYWIWKHGTAEYLGLYHYRRFLDMQEEDLGRLKENDIDVILPYPTIHFPDIREHHKRYLRDNDWEAMERALREYAPDYAAALPEIFAGQYFYNYNILIAREKVFKDYCNWLFPILERTEELSIPKGKERADRYIGYLGENLTTLYFLYHKNDYRIAHAGRRMLI